MSYKVYQKRKSLHGTSVMLTYVKGTVKGLGGKCHDWPFNIDCQVNDIIMIPVKWKTYPYTLKQINGTYYLVYKYMHQNLLRVA